MEEWGGWWGGGGEYQPEINHCQLRTQQGLGACAFFGGGLTRMTS